MKALRAPDGEERLRIAFPEARRAMLAAANPLAPETVSLLAGSGRVAARTLFARDDIVPFARSAMDGYAVRAAETAAAGEARPVLVPVASATYAGDAPGSLSPGFAAAIATGAPLPAGADAVVPFEDVTFAQNTIALRAPLVPGEHVFEPGDDAKRGDVLIASGDVVTPGRTALLAAGGYATVAVHRRPRIAIVSTGNELVAVAQTPARGQIRNSNAAMLAACVEGDGAEVVSLEHARDAEAPLRETLLRALAGADLVITTGGASTGERDFVKASLRALGATFAFDSIALRPAKPTGFARLGATLVATLPGNPAAAYVAYVALVRAAIRRLAGHPRPAAPVVRARLDGTIHRKAERHFLMFATLAIGGDGFTVRPLENQCSSLVRTSADANALIVAEPGNGYVHSGEPVPVEILDWAAVAIDRR